MTAMVLAMYFLVLPWLYQMWTRACRVCSKCELETIGLFSLSCSTWDVSVLESLSQQSSARHEFSSFSTFNTGAMADCYFVFTFCIALPLSCCTISLSLFFILVVHIALDFNVSIKSDASAMTATLSSYVLFTSFVCVCAAIIDLFTQISCMNAGMVHV